MKEDQLDYEKRAALAAMVGDLSSDNNLDAYVSLENFFDGNDDAWSMWPNVENRPETAEEIYSFLKTIRSRPDVNDVLIWIYSFDDDDDVWLLGERVVILTEAQPKAVVSWFKKYPPDDWFDESEDPMVADLLRRGVKAIALWWD